jgi:plasmid stabilization system protein ParE
MPRLLFTESAQADLLEAWLYIADENPVAADGVLSAIEGEARLLLGQPLIGKSRPELGDGVRSWPTSTRYIIYYLPTSDGITVLRVLHHARDVQQIPF